MPATEGQRSPMSQGIPFTRVILNDPSQLPIDYSSTPGGTLYSTTPGGTRIVYDRTALMNLRNSPLSRAAPPIPDYLCKGSKLTARTSPTKNVPTPVEESHEQFEIDI